MENDNNNDNGNSSPPQISDVLNLLSKLMSPSDVTYAKITGQFVVVLSSIRKNNEYSIQEFADLLGTDADTVNEWETGHHNFNLREIAEICCALNLDIDIILSLKESTDE